MEKNEQQPTQPQDSGLAFPFPAMSFPANVTLPVNIMADTTDYYLLTRDKIENLKAGSDSDESTWFGACFAVLLFAAGILITIYAGHAPHTMLTPFLWFAFIGSAALMVFFYRRLTRLRRERKERFDEILTKSKTVVTLASVGEPKPPSPQ
jgi:hypothetical protein